MLPLSRMATRLASWAPLQQQAHLMSTTAGQMDSVDLQCSLDILISRSYLTYIQISRSRSYLLPIISKYLDPDPIILLMPKISSNLQLYL